MKNDTATTYAAVEFLQHLDILDVQIKIQEEQVKLEKANRECLIYQGLTVMYRNRLEPKSVPVVDQLALLSPYLEA